MGSFRLTNLNPVEFYSLFAIITGLCILIVLFTVKRKPVTGALVSRPKDSSPAAKEWLARALGGLWVLDGLLQTQPAMITRFVGGLLAPLAPGQPWPLNLLIKEGMSLWSLSPVLWNEFAAWIQLGIGLGILFGRHNGYRRISLWVAIVWGISVWIVGEALGNIFVNGSWLSGSPGSALIYTWAAILLLASDDFWRSTYVVNTFRWGFAGLWFLAALLQALPSSGWWGLQLPTYVWGMALMPQPEIISGPLYAWAHALRAAPLLWNGALVASFTLEGILWSIYPHSRLTWWLTTVITFGTWWLGQDFGVLGGMGTDPNSGAIVLGTLICYARLVPIGVFATARDSQSLTTSAG